MYDTDAINSTADLLAIACQTTELKKHSTTSGGEWSGPCPMCGGRDRFSVQPFNRPLPRWLCRFCTDGKWKNAIDLIMMRDGMQFMDACERLGGDNKLTPEQSQRIVQERMERMERELAEQRAAIAKLQVEMRDLKRWQKYHEQMEERGQRLWNQRGLHQFWQDYWELGWTRAGQVYEQETLSIPVWGIGRQVNNIKHRLIGVEKGGKYLQETRGIPASPFVGNLDASTGPALIVEGEIKAMVSFATWDGGDLQVIGIPGKSVRDISTFDGFDPIYICLDPDARRETRLLGEDLGRDRVRVIELHDKIDDLINRHKLDKQWMRRTMRQAVRL